MAQKITNSLRIEYEFQAIAREEKGGLIGGIDYNKSPTTKFKTSKHINSNKIVRSTHRPPKAAITQAVQNIITNIEKQNTIKPITDYG